MMKKALITGINGMDGSFMAELLLKNNYEVHGTVRIDSNLKNLENIKDKIILYKGDLTNINFIYKSVICSMPDVIFHFASISQNDQIWNDPVYTYKLNGESTLNFLEAIKNININIKFMNCSSSEIFGDNLGKVTESSPKNPKTPYGISKLFSYQNVLLYRDKYGLFASNAICFNHESERRSSNFLTKKLSQGIAKIKIDKNEKIKLGDINSSKDWGYAPDFIFGIYKLMNYDIPEDVIFATGKLTSINEILNMAFEHIQIQNWSDFVIFDKEFTKNRYTTNNYGDISKAQSLLDWKNQTDIHDVLKKMIDFELENS